MVSGLCNVKLQQFSFLNIQTWIMIIHTCAPPIVCTIDKYFFYFLRSVGLTYIIHPKCLGVSGLCNLWLKQFHSFIFKFYTLWFLTHWTCAPYILFTFDNILGVLNLLRLHQLWSAYIVYLCVIWSRGYKLFHAQLNWARNFNSS